MTAQRNWLYCGNSEEFCFASQENFRILVGRVFLLQHHERKGHIISEQYCGVLNFPICQIKQIKALYYIKWYIGI